MLAGLVGAKFRVPDLTAVLDLDGLHLDAVPVALEAALVSRHQNAVD